MVNEHEHREWVKELTEGFELRPMPKFVSDKDLTKLIKADKFDDTRVEIYPTVSAAFPVIGATSKVLSGYDYFTLQNIPKQEAPVRALIASPQETAAAFNIMTIDYAGRLIDALHSWAVNEPWSPINVHKDGKFKLCRVEKNLGSFLPSDAPDNMFLKLRTPAYEPFGVRDWQKFEIPEGTIVGDLPRDLILGPYVKEYASDLYADMQVLEFCRKASVEKGMSFSDDLSSDRKAFFDYFSVVRRIHETGADVLSELERISKDEFLAWKPAEFPGIRQGDVVAGFYKEEVGELVDKVDDEFVFRIYPQSVGFGIYNSESVVSLTDDGRDDSKTKKHRKLWKLTA